MGVNWRTDESWMATSEVPQHKRDPKGLEVTDGGMHKVSRRTTDLSGTTCAKARNLVKFVYGGPYPTP